MSHVNFTSFLCTKMLLSYFIIPYNTLNGRALQFLLFFVCFSIETVSRRIISGQTHYEFKMPASDNSSTLGIVKLQQTNRTRQ